MKAPDLFAIDVPSELRALAGAQLGGTWQLPAELVRFALRCGARELGVWRRRRCFTIRWRGAALANGVLEDLAAALDGRLVAPARQRAIAGLEAAGAGPLLAGGALPGARLRVDSSMLRFERKRGGRPRLRELTASESAPRQEIQWSCSGLDAARAASWLATACRFADAEISLDGTPLARGFVSGMYHLVLEEPVPCRIGLTGEGDFPVLWLLRDGIVSAKAGLPGYPPFEAAVELAGVVPEAASSADLRRAVQPYVIPLADRAVWMMVRLHARFETMQPAVRSRLELLLLRAATRGLREQEVMHLPLFETLAAADGRLSLSRIAALGRRHGGRLYAIGPDRNAAGILADPAMTLVMSAEARPIASELSGVRLEPPPRRHDGRIGRLLEIVGELCRRWMARARGMRGGHPLADHELIETEKRLLDLVRAAVVPRTVSVGTGGGEVRRTATGWVIPRRNPVLAAAARATAEHPAWLYPLLLALDLGEPPPSSLRESWQRLAEAP
jgi:hypothetical protein